MAFPRSRCQSRRSENELPLQESFSAEEFFPGEPAPDAITMEDAKLKAVLEAIIYVTDEPLTLDQICTAIEQPRDRVIDLLEQLAADYERPERGLSIREIAGGFKMTTKPEHHEAVRRFVKNLSPPLKLSLPALETLAVIAYKQPITSPEIMEIRGVQGAGVLKTLLDRKLIGIAGRKQVIGKPFLYKTTREFLVQFGLKDVGELPSLKEFQELGAFRYREPGHARRPGCRRPADARPGRGRVVAEERLQKILATAGIASRRKAEVLITEGRVTVNGTIVSELGSKADPDQDHIKVDGRLIKQPEHFIYIALNKPDNVVSTVSDPQKRATVLDLPAGGSRPRISRGRLDYHSQGLILLTNDGEFANAITSARSHVPKTYLVKSNGYLTPEQEEEFRTGVPLSGRRTAPAGLHCIRRGDNPWYEVRLIEGRNQQVRIMFKHFGRLVEKLRRVRIGNVELGSLKPGEFRHLTPRRSAKTDAGRERKNISPSANLSANSSRYTVNTTTGVLTHVGSPASPTSATSRAIRFQLSGRFSSRRTIWSSSTRRPVSGLWDQPSPQPD